MAYYESVECIHAPLSELVEIVAEASSFHKILLDLKAEGYSYIDDLVAQTDALARLQNFLTKGLARLGPPSEKERFHLYPEVIEINGLADPQFADGPRFTLRTYLSQLDDQASTLPEIAHCFESPAQMQHWQAKTAILLSEMLGFLRWIVKRLQQQPEAVPVLLLRDTLLVYFGLQWVRDCGLAIPVPQPIFLSRKFTATVEGKQDIYATLSSNILFGILDEVGYCDVATYRRHFVSRASQVFTEDHPFTQNCRAYLRTLALTGPPLIIESGLHGTFPLWLLTLTNNVGDFVLYTTAPWLYPIYGDIVYRKNYNYLRDMETIVVHDCLFQFETVRDGEITVAETCNPIAKRLAHYELFLFKQLVKQQMEKLLSQ
ncbi:MAG: hypothetical protein R3E79_34320 [Caldilineaceae bacterium]